MAEVGREARSEATRTPDTNTCEPTNTLPDLGEGAPLDAGVRSFAERSLGASLGSVTVHTDTAAQTFTRNKRARAATIGEQIAFSAGAHRPGTLDGDALLAHELAHVAQQSGSRSMPRGPLAAGPPAAEADADVAAASALLRSGRHRGAIGARIGTDPTGIEVPRSGAPKHKVGLSLQRCGPDIPDYAGSGPAPAPQEPSRIHRSGRAEQGIERGGRFWRTIGDTAYRATIDGDGDQSAELSLAIRGRDYDVASREVRSVEVETNRLGNRPDPAASPTPAQTVSFDTSGAMAGGLTPRLVQRTDGRQPTKIEATGSGQMRVADLQIDPPPMTGPTAIYRMTMTKGVSYQTERRTETHSVSFPRDPDDVYPVFLPNTPRRAGNVWVVDAGVGRFGDPFRFTFRSRPGGTSVTMTISALGPDGPLGVDDLDIPLTGSLTVAIVSTRGPFLALDLNGDGRADVRVYQEMRPESDWHRGSWQLEPSRFRRLSTTVTNGDGTRRYGGASRSVSEGRYDDTSFNMEDEFGSMSAALALEGMQQSAAIPDLTSDLGATISELRRIRMAAAAGGTTILSEETSTAFDALTDAWLDAARQQGTTGDPAKNRAAAARATAFDALWNRTTASATTHASARGYATESNRYSGAGSTSREYSVTRRRGLPSERRRQIIHQTDSTASRLAAALQAGDRTRASTLMRSLNTAVSRWVAARLRALGRSDEAARVEGLVALEGQLRSLSNKETTRVSGVFHSKLLYAQQGNRAGLPLRMYYWKEGSTWYLKDLTNPTKTDATATLSTAAGTEAQPPHALFEKLNHKKRYPEGVLRYQIPGDTGRAGTVTTTEPWELSDILGWIGMGFAAAALVTGWALSGGTATPIVVPLLWGLSAGFTAAGAAAHMVEEHDQGRLTGSVIAMDVATILASVASIAVMGSRAVQAYRLGAAVNEARAAGTAITTGQAAALAPLGTGSMVTLLVTQVGADAVQVVLMSEQLATSLREIDASPMSSEDKFWAKARALGGFGLAVGLAFVSVRASVGEVRQALAANRQLIQSGGHTLIPGMYTSAQYSAHLQGALSADALAVMAPGGVRKIAPAESGSSLGLAHIEMVGGKARVVVIDGAPLTVVREEAVHLEQLALRNADPSTLSPAQQRIRTAARRLTTAQASWSARSEAQQLQAHRAALELEADGQFRLIALFEADEAAGRAVNHADVDNAWQNIENLQMREADLAGAQQRLAGGARLADIDPRLTTMPRLRAAQTIPNTPLDDAWKTLGESDFVAAYRARYPNTTLTDADLARRWAMNKQLNPTTGRLIDPSQRVPDRVARYAGDAQTMAMRGQNATQPTTAERQRIDDLLSERDAARASRDAAPDRDTRNLQQYSMNEASRELGEHAAGMWVRRTYPGPPAPTMLYPTAGGSRPGDFDQIWSCRDSDGRLVVIVVEAKGGRSPLGSRMVGTTTGGLRAQQGTRLYFDEILRLMGGMGGEAERAAAAIRTARAADPSSVRYVHVKAPIEYQTPPGAAGQVAVMGDVTAQRFDTTDPAN